MKNVEKVNFLYSLICGFLVFLISHSLMMAAYYEFEKLGHVVGYAIIALGVNFVYIAVAFVVYGLYFLISKNVLTELELQPWLKIIVNLIMLYVFYLNSRLILFDIEDKYSYLLADFFFFLVGLVPLIGTPYIRRNLLVGR